MLECRHDQRARRSRGDRVEELIDRLAERRRLLEVGRVPDLLPPRQVIAAQPVREHQRGPGTGDFEMNLGVGTTQAAGAAGRGMEAVCRHGGTLSLGDPDGTRPPFPALRGPAPGARRYRPVISIHPL
jgi:hypothetical protein